VANALDQGNAAAHEGGHTFGLRHFGGKTAPPDAIMSTFNSGPARLLWRIGTTDPSQTPVVFQDDMAIIASPTNTFGYRPDEAGTAFADAAVRTPTGSNLYQAPGVISQPTADADTFRFVATSGGPTNIRVDVDEYVNDLDVVIRLFDKRGDLLAVSAPGDSFDAFISLPLGDDTYFLQVASNGQPGEAG